MQSAKIKIILRILLLAGVIGAVVGLTFLLKPGQKVVPKAGLFELPQELAGQKIVMSDYLRLPGKTGKTALELSQESAKIEVKKYDFGVFVESINGVKPDEKHFWKLYYNGQESQVGADQLSTSDGDVVEWKIEDIKN